MRPTDGIAACIGGAAYWVLWVGSSTVSRQVGEVETYREAHGGRASTSAPWKSKGILLHAVMLGIGIVVMRQLTGFTLLQALGFWLAVMASPAAYKYHEGVGEYAREVGVIRAVGFLLATLVGVAVVYSLSNIGVG